MRFLNLSVVWTRRPSQSTAARLTPALLDFSPLQSSVSAQIARLSKCRTCLRDASPLVERSRTTWLTPQIRATRYVCGGLCACMAQLRVDLSSHTLLTSFCYLSAAVSALFGCQWPASVFPRSSRARAGDTHREQQRAGGLVVHRAGALAARQRQDQGRAEHSDPPPRRGRDPRQHAPVHDTQ